MTAPDPIAFMSYVRSDDDHDDGRITAFRRRLEGEVRIHTGRKFPIFQDRNDISWGQHWQETIDQSLFDVTFLIPILTPSFFQSPACRAEFKTFALKEKTLGVNRLILPLYYVTCDELGDAYAKGSDELVDVIRERNWTDWREFRFKSFAEEKVAASLAEMAKMIKASIAELNAIKIAASPKGDTDNKENTIKSLEEIPPVAASVGRGLKSPVTSLSPTEKPIIHGSYKVPETSGDVAEGDAGEYRAFTTRFDEVVDAGLLADQAELLKLYKFVSGYSNALKKLYRPALSEMLSDQISATGESPIAVTILIDNSGSMRGRKIIHTAAWCLLILDWMDRLGIPTEILGFTTRAWKGGQSREMWLTAGKPANPGRLNDLRYLVYKSFSASFESSAPNFGVLAREGLLKENIDGEALLWAASRLRDQKNKKKLLFIFSDGAPVDDSTLSVNPDNYLERHLKKVIATLSSELTLYGVGLEHDVSAYYENAVTVDDVSILGLRFFEALLDDPDFQSGWFSKRDILTKPTPSILPR